MTSYSFYWLGLNNKLKDNRLCSNNPNDALTYLLSKIRVATFILANLEAEALQTAPVA